MNVLPDPKCLVRRMTANDLSLVLRWRNHPDVRCHMFTQHTIGAEEHEAWFARNQANEDRRLLIFECDGVAQGFANLNRLTEEGLWDWGFYLSPTAPKGAGRRLGHAVLNFAFVDMKIHKLCARVIMQNDRSIRFHQSLGFETEGALHAQHIAGGVFDIVCFGLTHSAWHPEAST